MKLISFPQLKQYVKNNKQKIIKGNSLITLLIFMVVAITIAATSVAVIINNVQNTHTIKQGFSAYYAAESGVENAALQLLRNPGYTGETLMIGDDTAVISVTGGPYIYTIKSVGKNGGFTRTIESVIDYTDNIMTVVSWRELYP